MSGFSGTTSTARTIYISTVAMRANLDLRKTARALIDAKGVFKMNGVCVHRPQGADGLRSNDPAGLIRGECG